MSPSTALAAVASVAVGTLGAAVAYQAAAPSEPAGDPVAVGTPARQTGEDRPRFAPCRPPAVLRAGRCVTERTRTVVVPAPVTSRPEDDDHAGHGSDDDDDRDDDHSGHGSGDDRDDREDRDDRDDHDDHDDEDDDDDD